MNDLILAVLRFGSWLVVIATYLGLNAFFQAPAYCTCNASTGSHLPADERLVVNSVRDAHHISVEVGKSSSLSGGFRGNVEVCYMEKPAHGNFDYSYRPYTPGVPSINDCPFVNRYAFHSSRQTQKSAEIAAFDFTFKQLPDILEITKQMPLCDGSDEQASGTLLLDRSKKLCSVSITGIGQRLEGTLSCNSELFNPLRIFEANDVCSIVTRLSGGQA